MNNDTLWWKLPADFIYGLQKKIEKEIIQRNQL